MLIRLYLWAAVLGLARCANVSVGITLPAVNTTNTAAAVSKGGIAAAAAEAAGASKDEVIQTAAMIAGQAAAQDARTGGEPEVRVEAQAANAAQAAALRAGATGNEAAEAGGETAVLVAGQVSAPPLLLADAFSIVNGTDCLNWWGDGCVAITDHDACLSSRDGGDLAEINGVKVFGEPCVWCGGEKCGATDSLCVPRNAGSTLHSGTEVASCTGGSGLSETSAAAQWSEIPASLKAGGFPQRELFFVPKKSQSVAAKAAGGACRGASAQDASNLDPTKRNYYATWTAATLKECLEICSWKQDCTGVEFSENQSYCEVWNVPIHFTDPAAGIYECYVAYPESGQPDGIKWRASGGLSTESIAQPTSSNLTLEVVLGAVILLGIVVAILFACRRWKKTPRKAKAEAARKRGLDIDQHAGDAVGSGDEMQPLVNGAFDYSSPTSSFASGYGGSAWNQSAPFSFAPSGSQAGQASYEPLAQGGQPMDPYRDPQAGSQTTYLQQLRQWLQDYEAARFRELAQLQANAQARFGCADGVAGGGGVSANL